MSEKEDIRRIRIERLDNVYKVLSDLVRHEDERFSESLYSSNHVLLLLKNILPLAGTLLNINGLYSLHKRLEAMGFWKERIYRIEADSDFISEQYGGGLDIFTARKTHLEKKHSKYPGLIIGILKYQRYYMGILFLIVWILALGAQLYSYL